LINYYRNMKQLIFIIIFKISLVQSGNAQNQFVAKMLIPENPAGSLIKLKINTHPYHIQPQIIYAAEPADNTALFFNDQPVVKLNKNKKRPVLLLTQLSFSDVLENSMNEFKADLVNTYDDHIIELFKDAPSIFKVKCIIAF
jgi:hypothetical protein